MEIKRYYIADLSFALSKFNICVCLPFEQDGKLFIDMWHPETQCYFGQHNLTRDRKRFFSNICADFYSLEEAFSAVADFKAPFAEKDKVTGYKILRHDVYTNAYLLGVLEVAPKDKKVVPYFSNKVRAERALVKDILKLVPYKKSYQTDLYSGDSGISAFSPKNNIRYMKGRVISADSFDDDKTMVSTHGIHFYLTQKDAINSLKRICYA